MNITHRVLFRFAGVAAGVALAGAVALAHDGEHHGVLRDGLAVTDLVLTGSEGHMYENVPEWCKLPEGQTTLGPTHGGIVEDKQGLIYWTMAGGPVAIYVYNPDGTLNRKMGDEKLVNIHGVCINDEGGEQFIYGAHLGGKCAVKLKLDGTLVWEIPFDKVKESGKYEDVKQYNPTGIAVGPDGSVFIADGYGQNWIHKFDKDQKYVMSFGGKGTEGGKFQTCHGIGLDKRGEKPLLLVCDRENKRLQHFDLDGKFVAVIAENLRRPCAPSFHGDKVALAELQGRVTILDKDNKEIAHLGDNPDDKQWAKFDVPPTDWKPGIFTAPHGVSFDHEGNVYVMDWNASGRISKFKPVEGKKQNAGAGTKSGKLAAK